MLEYGIAVQRGNNDLERWEPLAKGEECRGGTSTKLRDIVYSVFFVLAAAPCYEQQINTMQWERLCKGFYGRMALTEIAKSLKQKLLVL